VNTTRLALILTIGATLAACGGPTEVKVPSEKLAFFKTAPITPKAPKQSNPEMVALGKALYHDKRLSSDGSISCASCHDLDTFGVDNKPTSPGVGGQLGTRNSPTSINAFKQVSQFWDGRAATVEDQALGPLLNPIEHGIKTEADLLEILKKDPGTVAAFAKAFPGDDNALSFSNVGNAIGAFERTLVTTSRFDKFLDGDEKALTNEEKQGLLDFVQVGCTTCHSSRMVGGQMMQKLGLVYPYPTKDLGKAQETKQDGDKFFFKASSLLNVEKTGPYLHDGSLKTLEEVVKMMAWNQLGKGLAPSKTKSIVAFLKSLTGELPAAATATNTSSQQ
jgi:cytochrome c peroxidase